MRKETTYEEFLERIKNPVTKCVMHDDAVNAASLIEMWKGIAEQMYHSIIGNDPEAAIPMYKFAASKEQEVINSYSWQGNNKGL